MADWVKRFGAGLLFGLVGMTGIPAHAQNHWWQLVVPGAWGGVDNGIVNAMAERGDSLYMGTYNAGFGCQLWARTPTGGGFHLMYKVDELGFGDVNNYSVASMAAFNAITNDVFVGTSNHVTGGEVWILTAGGDFYQTHLDGLGNSANTAIFSMAVFNGALYVGTNNPAGLEIHRYTGVTWPPPVVTGGFGNSNNTTAYSMTVHDGFLHVGTENVTNGGEIWRSANGTNWSRYVAGGFGGNAFINTLTSADGTLYTAIQGSSGVEVYAVGDGFSILANTPGFGDPNVDWPGAMVTFENTVYVGTGHLTTGAQVWRMNGYQDWTQIAHSGFGDSDNASVRSLAVYSGELWAGTAAWTDGAEVWRMVMIFNDDFETGDPSRWSMTMP